MPEHWTLMPSQYDWGPLRAAAAEVVRRIRPEAALLWTGAEFLGFGGSPLPPSVADRIDCRTLISLRHQSKADGLRNRVHAARTALAFARYERKIVRRLYTTIVVGQDDARVLRRLSRRGRIEVIPNGVAVEGQPDPSAEGASPQVIFSGVMGYRPNIDAATFFADQVWPLVLRAAPNATFIIAGRSPTPEVKALAGRAGIAVMPDVPDMRKALAAAWVAVAPMQSGAGIKNKVLEAWAVAKPVVMTSLASNGLRIDDQARQLVADDPEAMATLVVRLLLNGPERHRMGAAAHALARQEHGWQEAARRLSRILEDASQTSASTPP
jgi:glycosyltransferase involved in cell wall biosynthesis